MSKFLVTGGMGLIGHNVVQRLEAKEHERIKKDEEKLDPKPKMVLFPKEESIERKPRKPKRLAPEYVFIFDDLGNDLRHQSITQLFKTSRH